MIRIIEKKLFTTAAFIIVVVFWFFDASMHYFVYGESRFEFVPSDVNELWMRTVIVILIQLFGIYADSLSKRLLIAQRKAERARIYKSMIFATHHILNNLLNQMQLIRLEAMKSKDFDHEVIQLYDNAIDEAVVLIRKLSHIENITEENIKGSVIPRTTDNTPRRTSPVDRKNDGDDL